MNIKPFVFVLMPFDSSFDDIYKLGIKATCEELNTYCERVDEQIFEGNILDRIYNQINKADIIIADLTGKNSNVFYETGYAHALNKKVVLLTQNEKDIPFDLTHYYHIVYEGKILKLKDELKKRIDWFIKNPTNIKLPNEFNVELYINGIKLDKGVKIDIKDHLYNINSVYGTKTSAPLKIDMHNNSQFVYDSTLRIGIITNANFYGNSEKDNKRVIKISESECLHLSNNYLRIYPYSWDSFEISLYSDVEENLFEKELPITIRLFTEFGIKDYPIFIAYQAIDFKNEGFY